MNTTKQERERERGSQQWGEGRCAVLLLRLADGRVWGKRDKPRRASALGWLARPDGPCRHTLKQAGRLQPGLLAAGVGLGLRQTKNKEGKRKEKKTFFPISEMRF